MSTISISPEAAAYLAALRDQLADLDADERDELLADVEVSLVEAPSAETPEQRFGPPARFAAELRAAAGFAPAAAGARGVSLGDRVRELLADERVQDGLARLRPLAPIWWVARACVVIVALVDIAGIGRFSTTHAEVPIFGNETGTLLLLLALVTASCVLGLRGRRTRAVAAANVVLLVLAVPAVAHTFDAVTTTPSTAVIVTEQATPGLTRDGVPIHNIYAFGRDGKPLHDVLLYDQDGRALTIGGPTDPDPGRRVVRTARGTKLYNAFPIRYFEPGTHRVAHPDAGPKKRGPRVVTAPLKP